MHAIDAITTELADRGWSVGECAYRDVDAAIWQVFLHHDGEKVVARAPDQTTAWRLAARQIIELRRGSFMERLTTIEETLQQELADADRIRLLEESDMCEFELGRDYLFERDCLA